MAVFARHVEIKNYKRRKRLQPYRLEVPYGFIAIIGIYKKCIGPGRQQELSQKQVVVAVVVNVQNGFGTGGFVHRLLFWWKSNIKFFSSFGKKECHKTNISAKLSKTDRPRNKRFNPGAQLYLQCLVRRPRRQSPFRISFRFVSGRPTVES